MINSISFVIFDAAEGTTRIEGVSTRLLSVYRCTRTHIRRQRFGGRMFVVGEPFYSSDVLAFGGFAQTDAGTRK